MAGRLSTRLAKIERRLRPAVSSGISHVILMVTQSELSQLGEPCPIHANCSARRTGLVTTHFRADEKYRQCD